MQLSSNLRLKYPSRLGKNFSRLTDQVRLIDPKMADHLAFYLYLSLLCVHWEQFYRDVKTGLVESVWELLQHEKAHVSNFSRAVRNMIIPMMMLFEVLENEDDWGKALEAFSEAKAKLKDDIITMLRTQQDVDTVTDAVGILEDAGIITKDEAREKAQRLKEQTGAP